MMELKEYLRINGGDNPFFEELEREICPHMEVRKFLKGLIREEQEGEQEGNLRALTGLKLILLAFRHDREEGIEAAAQEEAHESDSILQTLRTCFFSQGWLFELFYRLSMKNTIEPWVYELGKEVAQVILKFGERDANNRAFFYALGHVYAAMCFPDAQERNGWLAYGEAVFYDWYEGGDCYEPGYIAHNIAWVIKLGRLLGKDEELKSSRAVSVYKRYRDHVSPGGLVIAPGDGDDQSSYLEALRAMYEVTGDGTFLWAYEMVAAAGEYGGYRGKKAARIKPVSGMVLGNRPVTGCTQVQLQYPETAKLKDRILLNPSREPGRPYMGMMIHDHYDTLHHESEDNRGEIYHYEADGVLYLRRSSWYKWAEQTNTLVMKDAIMEYPFVYSEGMVKDHWYCGSADLRLMEHFMPDEKFEMCLENFDHFSHFHKTGPVIHDYDMPLPLQYRQKDSPYGVFLSNPRGMAGENRTLCLRSVTVSVHTFPKEYWEGGIPFERAMTWNRDEHRKIAYTDLEPELEIKNLHLGGPAGKMSLCGKYELPKLLKVICYPISGGQKLLTEEEVREILTVTEEAGEPVFHIHCLFGRMDFMFDGFDELVDTTAQYNRIGFDYRYRTNVRDFLRTPIKVLVNRITTRSSHIDQQQGGILTGCKAEQKEMDCYGEASYESVYTYDTSWTRKTLLTQEGYLIVVDEVLPGDAAEGMAGGPVWQLPEPPVMGLEWADAKVEKELKRNLLVYCHPQRGHRYGIQCQPKLWVDREYAFYDRAVFLPGRKEVFISVLLPHEEAVQPLSICRRRNEGGSLEPALSGNCGGVVTELEKGVGIVTEIDGNQNVTVIFHEAEGIAELEIHMDGNGTWRVLR